MPTLSVIRTAVARGTVMSYSTLSGVSRAGQLLFKVSVPPADPWVVTGALCRKFHCSVTGTLPGPPPVTRTPPT